MNKFQRLACIALVVGLGISPLVSAYDPDRMLPDGSSIHPYTLIDDPETGQDSWVVYTNAGPQIWGMTTDETINLINGAYIVHCIERCSYNEHEYQIENVNLTNRTMIANEIDTLTVD